MGKTDSALEKYGWPRGGGHVCSLVEVTQISEVQIWYNYIINIIPW